MSLSRRLQRLYRSDVILPFRWKLAIKVCLYNNLGFLFTTFPGYIAYRQRQSLTTLRGLSAEQHDHWLLSQHKTLFARAAAAELSTFLASALRLHFGGHSSVCQPRCNVIVVVHNKAELTYRCLRALKDQLGVDVHLIVVDNASTDSTVDLLNRLDGSVVVVRNQANHHFLLACNQAFDLLKGQPGPIALVNNDAVLEPLALQSALRCLERFRSAGAVTGMVVHPDGRLQEAGSVLFSDGSCLGVGRRGDPFDPLFNVRRPVDYGSGCLLMIRSGLLAQLNGFDPLFAPAYYEETDLCVRLSDQGWQVIYEPTCRAMHVEFASSGGSLASVQALMEANRLKLLQCHASRLRGQPEALAFDSHDPRQLINHLHSSSRVLWIDDHPPNRQFGAGFARLQDIIETLATAGCWLTVFTTNSLPGPADQRLSSDYELLAGGEQDLIHLLKQRAGFYTHICASRHHNLALLDSVSSVFSAERPVFVADVESLFSIRDWTRQHLLNRGAIASLPEPAQIPELATELRLMQRFDRLLSVSESESTMMAKATGLPTWQVGHLLVPHPTIHPFNARQGVLFLGAIHDPSSPNLDSLRWLLEEILPALSAIDGAASIPITIAGYHQPALVADLYHQLQASFPQVTCLGFVTDVSELLQRHRVFVAPTRFAAGLPHKVHLAAAHGLPVIATPLLADQMGWTPGDQLLVGSTGVAFADAVVRLHTDPSLWNALSRSALQRVSAECDPARMFAALRAAFDLPDGC